MHREHIVPLSRQAVQILRQAKAENPDSELIFPSRDSDSGVLSENAMLYALYRMGYHKIATVLGFRTTFSTILNENEFNGDWIEMQLAHAEDDEVRAAYNAADGRPQRRKMMQWWADHLDKLAGQGILQLRRN